MRYGQSIFTYKSDKIGSRVCFGEVGKNDKINRPTKNIHYSKKSLFVFSETQINRHFILKTSNNFIPMRK